MHCIDDFSTCNFSKDRMCANREENEAKHDRTCIWWVSNQPYHIACIKWYMWTLESDSIVTDCKASNEL